MREQAKPPGGQEASLWISTMRARQEIYEVVVRYCQGLDRRDMALVRSCYLDGGIDHHTGHSGTCDEFIAWLEPQLLTLAGTFHAVTNHHCEVDLDARVAHAETYCLATHWGQPADDPNRNFTSLARYLDRFKCDGAGRWRIAERHAVRDHVLANPCSEVVARPLPDPGCSTG